MKRTIQIFSVVLLLIFAVTTVNAWIDCSVAPGACEGCSCQGDLDEGVEGRCCVVCFEDTIFGIYELRCCLDSGCREIEP